MLKSFALGSLSVLITALFFKLLHFPGWDLLFIISLGLLLPIYYLIELIVELRCANENEKKEYRLLTVISFLGISILMYGIMCGWMHWNGYHQLLFISLVIIIPLYFIAKGLMNLQYGFRSIIYGLNGAVISVTFCFGFLRLPGITILILITFLMVILTVVLFLTSNNSIAAWKLDLSSQKTFVTFTVIISSLLWHESTTIPIRVLESEISAQFELQEKIDQEISIGSDYINNETKIKSLAIDSASRKLLYIIDEVKLSLIEKTNGPEHIRIARNEDKSVILWKKIPVSPNLGIVKLNLYPLENKGDFNIPMDELIGTNINRIDASKSGLKIYRECLNYYSLLKQELTINSNAQSLFILKRYEEYFRSKETTNYQDVNDVHWMTKTFDHATLVQAIVKLTQMQFEIVQARSIALSGL